MTFLGRFLPACLAILAITLGPLARAAEPRTRGRLFAAHGVTPGGLVYVVTPAARTLTLRTPLGTRVASYPMQADERLVVGVADDGSRVTSSDHGEPPSDDGIGPGRPARYLFRDPEGNITASRSVAMRRDSTPAVIGTEVYSLAREKREYLLLRTSASEEGARVGRLEAARLTKEVGRPQRIAIRASAAGVLVEFRGAMATLYFDPGGSGRFVRPDASLSCGYEDFDQVFPAVDGGVGRLSIRYEPTPNGFERRGDIEWLDRTGLFSRSTELGEIGELFPLPSGQLLVLDKTESRVMDERGGELSRVPFSIDEGIDARQVERAVAAARRLERLGEMGEGGDWVEVALGANGDASRFVGAARRDPMGVLSRLAEVPDASPDLPAARVALATFLSTRGFENGHDFAPRHVDARALAAARKRWDAVLQGLEILVGPGESGAASDRRRVPWWIERQAAVALLAARGASAPPWVIPAAADAIAAGETAGVSALPDEVFTPQLAELTMVLDVGRMERFEREHPELSASWALRVMNAEVDSDALRFHVPVRRFAASLLSCLPGSGPIRFQAVVEALAEVASDRRSRERASRSGFDDGAASPARTPSGSNDSSAFELGPIASLLLEARHADDADLRAGAQLLFPAYGIDLDARSFREDVIRRRVDMLMPAASLVTDHSLSSASFTSLFSEVLLKARSGSRDPQACALMAFSMPSSDEEEGVREDPYCQLLQGAIRSGVEVAEELSDQPNGGRSREIAAWTRSSSASPEIRLQASLSRLQAGMATDSEILELWSNRDLPWDVRRWALRGTNEPRTSPVLAAEWSRELRGRKRSGAEESALLAALRELDPAEAAGIAQGRWENGAVATGNEGEQDVVWVKALDPSRLAADPSLRAILKRSIGDEGVGPPIAAALAKAGDAEALPSLLVAIRTGCLT